MTMKMYAPFVTTPVMKVVAYVRQLTTGYIMPVMVGHPEKLSNSVHKDQHHICVDHVTARPYRWARVMGSSRRTCVILLSVMGSSRRKV